MSSEPVNKGLAAAAAVGVALCLMLALPYLPAILGALILAVAFHRLHARIASALRNPSLAAFVSVLCVLFIVLVPAVLLATAAAGEIRLLYQRVPAVDAIARRLDPLLAWVAAHAGLSPDELRAALIDRIAQSSGAVLRSTTALAGALTEGVVQLVVGVMTLFFLLRDGDSLLGQAAASAPLKREQSDALLKAASQSIVANINGVLAVSAAQGLLAAAGFSMAGLPAPLLWGIAAAFFSMVPLIGTGIVWVPAAALLAAEGAWGRAALLVAWSAGVVAMADNVVRPWVVGKQIKANPLLVFFSLLGGVRVFGLSGLFIGPLILSLTSALLTLVWQPHSPESDASTGE